MQLNLKCPHTPLRLWQTPSFTFSGSFGLRQGAGKHPRYPIWLCLRAWLLNTTDNNERMLFWWKWCHPCHLPDKTIPPAHFCYTGKNIEHRIFPTTIGAEGLQEPGNHTGPAVLLLWFLPQFYLHHHLTSKWGDQNDQTHTALKWASDFSQRWYSL